MNQFIYGVTRSILETFPLSGPVLEIGSYQVPGQENVANLRPFFANQEYIGMDIRPGPGVDQVGNVEALPFADHSVGTVLALNTFEHVARFWRGFAEVERILKPDGVFILSCPFYFHIHNHPSDYWRFTPESLDVLLENYPRKILGWQGHAKKPLHVWAVAFGPDYPHLQESLFQKYRDGLKKYAREPLPWLRKLRYQLGRLVSGQRPYVHLLRQEHWETECRPPLSCTHPLANSKAANSQKSNIPPAAA